MSGPSIGEIMINESQYLKVKHVVDELLASHDGNYTRFVPQLEAIINDAYGALRTDLNPAITNLPNWDVDDIKFLVKEYSGFTNESIHMFHDATIRLKWDGVKDEIARNVSEEMGALTNGVPHLELMRQGYRDELGVQTEDVEYSACTQGFLNKMKQIFRSTNNAYTCGALLAFEATATFEFKAVEKILRTLKSRLDNGVIADDSITGKYILGHVSDAPPGENPEDDHYDGMRRAIGNYIDHGNAKDVIRGFVAVCTALNAWWEQLSIEVYSHQMNKFIESRA